MAVRDHIHKLTRLKYSTGNAIYFCTLDCSYKIETALALGKETICNICGNRFIMNEYSIRRAKPHCTNCNKRKVKSEDGKSHFVRVNESNSTILTAVAEDKVTDLRSRLDSVMGKDSDKDI